VAANIPSHAFFKGSVVAYVDAKLGVLTHAFNYGTGVVAGIRGYWNNEEGQLYLFRARDHVARLRASAKLLGMEVLASEDDLMNGLVALLRAERLFEDCYVRLVAYYSDETLGVRVHDLTADVTIVALPYGHYQKSETGVHVTISAWRRIDDSMIPAKGKISAAFVNVALARTQAQRAGFDEPILLDQDRKICESPLGSLVILRNGVFVTSPMNDSLMEGVTRRTVIELIKDEFGMDVIERPIDRNDLYLAEEAILCGTGIQVGPVTWADHIPIASGAVGKHTSRLRNLYFRAVRNNLEQYAHWCLPVYEDRNYQNRREIDERRGPRTGGADL
jgi:branched-chain amino acid aminotransferase